MPTPTPLLMGNPHRARTARNAAVAFLTTWRPTICARKLSAHPYNPAPFSIGDNDLPTHRIYGPLLRT